MKKCIATLLIAFLGAASVEAQTISQENFETAIMPALPAGWVQTTAATTGWKTYSGSITANSSWVCPAHTQYAVIDDWNNNETNNPSILKSPVFSLAGKTGGFLNFDYYYVQAFYNTTGQKETAYIQISTDGGANWTTIDSLAGKPSEWQNKYVNLVAYNNTPNLMLAFKYSDNGTAQLPGIAIDNFKVFVPLSNDATVTGISMPSLSSTEKAAGNGTIVKVNVMNNGANTITSLDMQYSVDGGTPVTQSFTGLSIAQFATSTLSFTTALSGIAPGSHNITVLATQVNTAADANPGDNQVTNSFIGVSNQVPRNGLIEEFTSSTCAPCASFNVTFDPLVTANNANDPASNFNVIKYQMNWPSPGNDASYNSHGDARKTYYGVNAIPDHFTNGAPGAGGNQAEIDDCKTGSSFLDITGTYFVTNDSIHAHVVVKPFFTYTHNLKVHIAVVEKDYYNYNATTSQKHYVHVMRLMLPSGTGTVINNWTDNTDQVFDFHKKVKSDSVTQGSLNIWTHPKNTNIVVFVQDDDTKQILQSKVIIAQWPVNVATLNNVNHFALYPNPTKDNTTAGFELNETTSVQLSVTDVLGQVVYTSSNKMDAGFHEMVIPTMNMAAGMYIVKLQTPTQTTTDRLSVVK